MPGGIADTGTFEVIDQPRPAEQLAAAITILAAVALAIQYYNEAKDAIDKQKEIADRIFAMQDWIAQHWLNNQYPQQLEVFEDTLNLTAPAANYSEIGQFVATQALRTSTHASSGIQHMFRRYRVDGCSRTGVNDAIMMGPVAGVHAAHGIARYEEDRFYNVTDHNFDMVSGAYHGTMEPPAGMFSLLSHAQNIYGKMGEAAINGFDGLAGVISGGIGTFIGNT